MEKLRFMATMEKVKLKFPSLNYLWEFTQVSTSSCDKIIIDEKYLECVCTKEDLYQAVNKYKAKIIWMTHGNVQLEDASAYDTGKNIFQLMTFKKYCYWLSSHFTFLNPGKRNAHMKVEV